MGTLRHAYFWAGRGCECLGRWNTSCSGPERNHPYDPGPGAKSWLTVPLGILFSPQRFSHQVMLSSCVRQNMEQKADSNISHICRTSHLHDKVTFINEKWPTLCWFRLSLTTHPHSSILVWLFNAESVHKNVLGTFNHLIKKGQGMHVCTIRLKSEQAVH